MCKQLTTVSLFTCSCFYRLKIDFIILSLKNLYFELKIPAKHSNYLIYRNNSHTNNVVDSWVFTPINYFDQFLDWLTWLQFIKYMRWNIWIEGVNKIYLCLFITLSMARDVHLIFFNGWRVHSLINSLLINSPCRVWRCSYSSFPSASRLLRVTGFLCLGESLTKEARTRQKQLPQSIRNQVSNDLSLGD